MGEAPVRTSRVKHHQISTAVRVDQTQEEFPVKMAAALTLMIDQAKKRYGATIDWTTLVVDAGSPLEILVDAVVVEEGWIQESKGLAEREDIPQDDEVGEGP